MSKKFLAVAGLTLDHADGSFLSGGTFTILPTPAPSSKVLAGGSGVYAPSVAFTLVGGDYEGGDDGTATCAGVITGSAVKSLVGGQLAVREGDSVLVEVAFTVSGVLAAGTATIEISDAGQNKVRGE